MSCVVAGALPPVLPASLEELVLDGGYMQPHAFTGGIPAGWASLTNLRKLSMQYCGLDGECG